MTDTQSTTHSGWVERYVGAVFHAIQEERFQPTPAQKVDTEISEQLATEFNSKTSSQKPSSKITPRERKLGKIIRFLYGRSPELDEKLSDLLLAINSGDDENTYVYADSVLEKLREVSTAQLPAKYFTTVFNQLEIAEHRSSEFHSLLQQIEASNDPAKTVMLLSQLGKLLANALPGKSDPNRSINNAQLLAELFERVSKHFANNAALAKLIENNRNIPPDISKTEMAAILCNMIEAAGSPLQRGLANLTLQQKRISNSLKELIVKSGAPGQEIPNAAINRTQLARVLRLVKNTRNWLEDQVSLSNIDGVTELANRAGFHERLQLLFTAEQHRTGTHSIILIDIANYRVLPPNHGGFGDNLSRTVAEVLQSVLNDSSAFIAHYDERRFAVLVPDMALTEAKTLSRILKQKIAAADFKHAGRRIPIAVTCAVAQLEQNDTADGVVERAGETLV